MKFRLWNYHKMSSLILINGVVFTLIPTVAMLLLLSGYFFVIKNVIICFSLYLFIPSLFLSQQIMFLSIFFLIERQFFIMFGRLDKNILQLQPK